MKLFLLIAATSCQFGSLFNSIKDTIGQENIQKLENTITKQLNETVNQFDPFKPNLE